LERKISSLTEKIGTTLKFAIARTRWGFPVVHASPIPDQPSERLEVPKGQSKGPRAAQTVPVSICTSRPLRLQVMSKVGSCNVGAVPGASKTGSSPECIV